MVSSEKTKKSILNHANLKSDFALICQRQQTCNSRLATNYDLSTKVYKDAMTKVCNARFGKILANFSEKNALKGKGKLYLRVKLLATVSGFPQANNNHAGTIPSNPIEPII